jgi:hypothetical protein
MKRMLMDLKWVDVLDAKKSTLNTFPIAASEVPWQYFEFSVKSHISKSYWQGNTASEEPNSIQ